MCQLWPNRPFASGGAKEPRSEWLSLLALHAEGIWSSVLEIRMNVVRDDILGRIRSALHDVPNDERPEDVAIVRTYRRAETDTRPIL